MTRRLPILLLSAAVALTIAPTAFAQSLQVSVTANGILSNIGPGGSLAITANGIGQAVPATVTVRSGGTATATITGATVGGTTEMTLLNAPAFPLTLSPGASTSFTVQYLPASGNIVSAQVSIAYSVNNQPSAFQFALTGTSPRLTFTYSFASGGALSNLNAGDAITFPATNTGASASATLNILNSGSANGLLSSVAVSGTAFQLSSSPAPVAIPPGQQVSLNVAFAPQASGGSQGLLTLGFPTSNLTFTLLGTGTAASLQVTYALADGNVHPLPSGTTIGFPSVDINATTTATIAISNQGSGSGTVTGISISGAAFQLSGLPSLPATVPAGQSLRFGIVFAPTQAGSYSGTFSINLTGSSISGTLAASTSSSNISLAYIDPNTNNTLSLQNNSTLQFPNTLVGSVTNITLVATNSGTGTGVINSIALGGGSAPPFQLLNLPALPVSVPPSQKVNFGIRFSPQQQQTFASSLVVNENGQNVTINLAAQGTGPQYTYTSSTGSGTAAVVPGGTIAIANTNVGQTASVTITVTNAGSGAGQIPGIAVTGQGFSLTNVPAVPITLQPSASQQFTLNFTPTQPGAISGQLTIGSDTFTVAGTAIGSLLIYTYTNSVATTTVTQGGTVIFAPIAVGNSETLTFSVQNTGTSAAAISSINLTAASAIFALQQLPGLPLNLASGATINFTVSFSPNNTGTLTATLAINSNNFLLSGTGTAPPTLPSYQFQGPSGSLQPAQQPALGLSLASAYPLPLKGTLTLTFASAVFTDDPSIQFASGGRTVNFTVAANSTQALFNGNVTTVPLQTGTTAGTITITPSFATQTGFDLTPNSPSALTLTIPHSVPQLTSASIASETLNSFTLILNGYTTTRVLTKLAIQIAPKQGSTFSTTSLTVDVSTASAAWFQGATSQPFGGSFMVAIPFTLSNGSSTADLVHLLQSLSITATNDVGTASSISVAIP